MYKVNHLHIVVPYNRSLPYLEVRSGSSFLEVLENLMQTKQPHKGKKIDKGIIRVELSNLNSKIYLYSNLDTINSFQVHVLLVFSSLYPRSMP